MSHAASLERIVPAAGYQSKFCYSLGGQQMFEKLPQNGAGF
jgi:hypothetical protein